MWLIDLTPVVSLVAPYYSTSFRGAPPRGLVCLFRSLLLVRLAAILALPGRYSPSILMRKIIFVCLLVLQEVPTYLLVSFIAFFNLSPFISCQYRLLFVKQEFLRGYKQLLSYIKVVLMHCSGNFSRFS